MVAHSTLTNCVFISEEKPCDRMQKWYLLKKNEKAQPTTLHNSHPNDHYLNNNTTIRIDSHLMFWVLQTLILAAGLQTFQCFQQAARYCHLTDVQFPGDWLAAILLLFQLSCSFATLHLWDHNRQSLVEWFHLIDSSTNQLLEFHESPVTSCQ